MFYKNVKYCNFMAKVLLTSILQIGKLNIGEDTYEIYIVA